MSCPWLPGLPCSLRSGRSSATLSTSESTRTGERDQAASVRAALDTNETWVAVTDNEITGFVNVIFDHAERSGEIYMIAVDPAAQRRGTATALTEFALREMRARGLTLAIVATGGDPGHAPARATYEKAGFTGCPQVWYAKQLN